MLVALLWIIASNVGIKPTIIGDGWSQLHQLQCQIGTYFIDHEKKKENIDLGRNTTKQYILIIYRPLGSKNWGDDTMEGTGMIEHNTMKSVLKFKYNRMKNDKQKDKQWSEGGVLPLLNKTPTATETTKQSYGYSYAD